jgi:hypothetical protein
VVYLSLLGFACYLCYVSRDIPTKFSEGKYVSIAMFSNLQIFVVGVPTYWLFWDPTPIYELFRSDRDQLDERFYGGNTDLW